MGWGVSACLKGGFWDRVPACSSFVQVGVVFNAERDLPHLISACNRTVVTSDDNTKVTNDCDLIKRDRRRPPAD